MMDLTALHTRSDAAVMEVAIIYSPTAGAW